MAKYDDNGFITELDKDEIFVFGSNGQGAHFGGAAATAVHKFGAKIGQAEGLQGQSYAINTMDSEDEMVDQIYRFLQFAKKHPELTFLVTEIGCGIAGYSPDEIAMYFENRTKNVVLPKAFLYSLGEDVDESKKISLIVQHQCWAMLGPGNWDKTIWKIYTDKTMEVLCRNWGEKFTRTKTAISDDEYKKIFSLLKDGAKKDHKIEALDGTAWQYEQYENGKLFYERKLGHIYSIKPFEALGHLLYGIAKLKDQQ